MRNYYSKYTQKQDSICKILIGAIARHLGAVLSSFSLHAINTSGELFTALTSVKYCSDIQGMPLILQKPTSMSILVWLLCKDAHFPRWMSIYVTSGETKRCDVTDDEYSQSSHQFFFLKSGILWEWLSNGLCIAPLARWFPNSTVFHLSKLPFYSSIKFPSNFRCSLK